MIQSTGIWPLTGYVAAPCSQGSGTLYTDQEPIQRLNDIITNIFLAPPLLSTATTQRKQHGAHHHLLGSKDDPDHGEGNETSLKHYRVSSGCSAAIHGSKGTAR